MDPTRSSAAGTKDAIAHTGDQWPDLAICGASWGDEEGKFCPKRPGPARLGYLLHYIPVPVSLGWSLSGFLQPCYDCFSSSAVKAAKITREESRHQKWNKRWSEWRAAVCPPMRRVARVLTAESCRTTSKFNDKPVWGRVPSNNSTRWCTLRVLIECSYTVPISSSLLASLPHVSSRPRPERWVWYRADLLDHKRRKSKPAKINCRTSW